MDRASVDPKQLFLAAVEEHAPDQWCAFLDQACGGDTALRQRVDELLAAHVQTHSLLDGEQLLVACAMEPIAERPGMTIGPYKLLEQIGEGGFGVVFMAEQLQPIRRKVALKVIKPGVDTRQVIARFDAERQTLALMDHPNIARVLDAGAAESGRPYFVMELVKGISITEYCDQFRLTMRERLDLFVEVCRAVQHAHQKGIIHRDLKPSNVLVTRHDGTPVVKVIDFGVSKATGLQLTGNTFFTGFTQLIGTPLYMSPEQAALSAVDVDTRSDIYSLGVLLYELLTGATPIDCDTFRQVGFDEMRRIISEVQPLSPSVRVNTLQADELSTISDRRHVEPKWLSRQIRGELDWIVMRALEKDRARRYQSASAFGADVERYLKDEPVEARPPSTIYRLTKLARRYKLALAAICAVAAALLSGTGISLWEANEANRARHLADARFESEKQARRESMASEARLRLQLYANELTSTWQAWNNGDTERALELLARHRPRDGEKDLRDFAWHYLNACCRTDLLSIQGHEAPLLTAAVSPDDRLIASGDREGTIKIWDLEKGNELRSWRYETKEVTSVSFSPDSRVLATAGQDRTVRLWDVATWAETRCLQGHSMTVCCVTWSPDGKWLASGGRDHEVRIWDVATGQEVRCLADHEDVVRCVAWSPDGKVVAAADGTRVRLWDAGTWELRGDLGGHNSGIQRLAFSPDGNFLASGGYDRQVIMHNIAERLETTRAEATGSVWSLAFSPDGQLLLAGVSDGGPNIWSVREAEKQLVFLRGAMERGGKQRAVTFARNGEALVTALEEERRIKVWRSFGVLGCEIRPFSEFCLAVDVDRDLAVTRVPDGTVHLHRFSNGVIQATLTGHHGPLLQAIFSRSGDMLATSGQDGQVFLWDTRDFQLRHRLAVAVPTSPTVDLSFSADGTLLASGNETGNVRLWNVATGAVLWDMQAATVGRIQMAFSPEGTMLATSSDSQPGVALWHVTSGKRVGDLETNQGIRGLAFSPDGALLVAAGDRHGVLVWDVARRREVTRLMGHRGAVLLVAVSPDSQTLATLGNDHSVRLWHLPTGQELFTLLGSTDVYWLQFASPHKLLVGTDFDDRHLCSVLIFDATDR